MQRKPVVGCVVGILMACGGIAAQEQQIPLYLYKGNVGVGTDVPEALFHVKGLFRVGATVTQSMVVGTTGNVGIGTVQPQSRLHVVGDGNQVPVTFSRGEGYGTVVALGRQGDKGAVGIAYSAENTLSVTTAGQERFWITSSGNIGIGTPAPLYMLSLEQGAFSARTGKNKDNSLNPLIVGYSGDPRFAASIHTYQGEGNKRHGFAFFTADAEKPEERLRIDANGYVGIGTDSPNDLLHLRKDQNADTVLQVQNRSSGPKSLTALRLNSRGNNFFLRNYGDSTDNPNRTDFYSNTPKSYFTFSPSSEERVRITDMGRVGIGTSAPESALQVVGTVNATGFVGDGSQLTGLASWGRVGEGVFYTTRNIGLGTSVPSDRLQVVGVSGKSAAKFLRDGDYGQVLTLGRNGVSALSGIGYPADGALSLIANEQERFRITQTGRVGIGTSTPESALQVVGIVNATGFVGDGSQLTGLASWDRVGEGVFYTTRNIGLGTSVPSDRLQVVGVSGKSAAKFLRDGDYGQVLTIGRNGVSALSGMGYPADGALSLIANEQERFRITQTGRVGIGTSMPESALQVVGIVNATGFVGDGSQLTGLASWDRVGEGVFYTTRNIGLGTSVPSDRLQVVGVSGKSAAKFLRDGDYGQVLTLGRNGVSALSGIGYPADGALSLIANEQERFRITQTGRVGIGTSTPESALDVVGTVNATAFVGDGSGLTGLVSWEKNGSTVFHTTRRIGVGTSTPESALDVVGTVNATAFVGDGSGLTGLVSWEKNGSTVFHTTRRIGVGTSTPESALDVVGTVNATAFVGDGSGLTGLVSWEKNGSTVFHTTRRIGVGTSTPESALDVVGTVNATAFVGDGSGLTGLVSWEKNGSTVFHTTRRIGVGTSTPESALDVVGTVNATAFVGDGSGLTGLVSWEKNGSTVFHTTRRIGVGTSTPESALDVVGTVNATAFVGDGSGLTGLVSWEKNGSTVFHTTRRIGVGTSTPESALDVVGTVNATAFVGDGSGLTGLVSWEKNGSTVFHTTRRIGVGTSTPESALDVVGTVNATAFVGDGSGLTGLVSWEKNGSTVFHTTRRIGVGTSTPESALDVVGTVNATAFVGDGSGLTGLVSWEKNGSTVFHTTRRIGVGTSTPESALDVVGTVNATAFVGDGSGLTGLVSWEKNGSTVFHTTRRIGVGTSTPESALDVVGTVNATAFVGDGSGLTGLVSWEKNGSTVFHTTRRIGVGTSTPESALDVVGTVNATAFVGDGSGLTNVSGGWNLSGADVFYTNKKVGVGTSVPASEFNVYRDQNAGTRVRIDNPNTGANAYALLSLGNGVSDVNFMMTGTGYASTHAINNPGGGATIYTGSTAPNGLVLGTTTGPLKFFAGSTTVEGMRLDGGRLLIGAQSSLPLEHTTSRVHIVGGSQIDATITMVRYSNDVWGGGLQIGKTRGTSAADVTSVVKGDRLGYVSFFGADGVDLNNLAAYMSSEVDGQVVQGVIPGRIAFHTRTEAGSIVERLRITSTGNVGIGIATPTSKLTVNGDIYGTSISTPYSFEWTARSTSFPNGSQNQKIYIDLGPIQYWGSLEVSIYDGWSYRRTTGKMTKLYDVGINIGTPYPSKSRLVESFGHVSNQWKLGEIEVGADNHVRIPIYHLASQQNEITVHVKGLFAVMTSGAEANFVLTVPESSTHTLDLEHVSMALELDQKIGIGTSTPASKLTVFESVSATVSNNYATQLNIRNGLDGGSRILFSNSVADNLSAILAGVESSGSGTDDGVLSFHTSVNGSLSEKMRINSAGNIGVGTTAPAVKFHIVDNTGEVTMALTQSGTTSRWYQQAYSSYLMADNNWLFYTKGSEKMRLTDLGRLGIGTPTPTQPLHVSGNALISSRMAVNATIDTNYALNVGGAIRATEMVLNVNGWADYVFEPDYPLMPLSEVESFVKKHRHLPGVPSESELKESGLNMAKVQTLQMQKIEELTLYVIALEKQNKALEARLEALEKRVAR